MLTTHVPMLLALLGTVLMAIVIFAPMPATRAPVRQPAEIYSPLPSHAFDVFAVARAEPVPPAPTWPALVDRSAAHCDADARLDLAGALAAVRAPWADAILQRALDEEPDVHVRAAIAAARSA
jgi:hypothetical protein